MGIRATVTGKNQITIPAAIVRELEIEPGMQLEFGVGEGQTVTVRRALSRGELARQLRGRWHYILQPGDDPIAELIREREQADEERD